MKYILILFVFLISCTTKTRKTASTALTERPPQFVLLAFDGSKSLSMWKETRNFAKENDIKFTYFISGVYFIPKEHRSSYVEPQKGKGKSAIGWGGSKKDVADRFDQLEKAISEGHEIASHANGHYNGATNTAKQWTYELYQFKHFLKNNYKKYTLKNPPSWWMRHIQNNITGFRAPQLGHKASLITSLGGQRYGYDTSKVSKMSYWPKKLNNKVWNFPLAGLRISGTGQKTLSMDYNFYFKDSKAKKGNPRDFLRYENQMYNTYMKYFRNNYFGNRAPIDIGHHFSKWNGGAYWKAMKRFAISVCKMPEVVCGTYQELEKFLEEQGENNILAFEDKNFKGVTQAEVNFPPLMESVGINREELNEEELLELQDEMKNHKDIHNEEDGPIIYQI